MVWVPYNLLVAGDPIGEIEREIGSVVPPVLRRKLRGGRGLLRLPVLSPALILVRSPQHRRPDVREEPLLSRSTHGLIDRGREMSMKKGRSTHTSLFGSLFEPRATLKYPVEIGHDRS